MKKSRHIKIVNPKKPSTCVYHGQSVQVGSTVKVVMDTYEVLITNKGPTVIYFRLE